MNVGQSAMLHSLGFRAAACHIPKTVSVLDLEVFGFAWPYTYKLKPSVEGAAGPQQCFVRGIRAQPLVDRKILVQLELA